MSENLIQTGLFENMEKLTLFAGDSLAKTSVSQGECKEPRGKSRPYGGKCSGSQKVSSHRSLSSKTPPSFDLKDWTLYSASSMRSGMMRSGTVYRLTPLAALTGGIASGLLPTPLASETGYRKGKFSQGGTSLSTHLRGVPNPEFVEWMMGFDLGHTDVDF